MPAGSAFSQSRKATRHPHAGGGSRCRGRRAGRPSGSDSWRTRGPRWRAPAAGRCRRPGGTARRSGRAGPRALPPRPGPRPDAPTRTARSVDPGNGIGGRIDAPGPAAVALNARPASADSPTMASPACAPQANPGDTAAVGHAQRGQRAEGVPLVLEAQGRPWRRGSCATNDGSSSPSTKRRPRTFCVL